MLCSLAATVLMRLDVRGARCHEPRPDEHEPIRERRAPARDEHERRGCLLEMSTSQSLAVGRLLETNMSLSGERRAPLLEMSTSLSVAAGLTMGGGC